MRKQSILAPAIGALLLSAAMGFADAYEVAEVAQGGSVSGIVTFEGTVPSPRLFKVAKDTDLCGRERVLNKVNAHKGFLQETVVVLEGVSRGKPFAARTYRGALPGEGEFRYGAGEDGRLEIRAKQCNFGPVAGVVVPEATVEFVNDDPVTHTIHTYAVFGREGRIHRTVHNRDVRAHSSMEETFTTRNLKESQVVRIGCDRHEFMQNWLYVVTTPYFAITDQDGTFRIDGIPPGQYELVAWHPALGLETTQVTIAANGWSEVAFGFSASTMD